MNNKQGFGASPTNTNMSSPASQIHRPGSSLLPKGAVHSFQHQNMGRGMGRGMGSNRGRPVGSYKGQADLRIPQPQMSQQQMRMRGMSPQMLASQQMLAVLNQQGLSVSGSSKGSNGSVTIRVRNHFASSMSYDSKDADICVL